MHEVGYAKPRNSDETAKRNLISLYNALYDELLTSDDRYKKNLIKLPTPGFFVFYNGVEKAPSEKEIRLSDAFILPSEGSLELVVKQININPDSGSPVLRKCNVMNEYSLFVDRVRECKCNGLSLEDAIKSCEEDGILDWYLSRKASEVINMLIADYNYEDDIRVQRQEAAEKAAKETRFDDMRKMHENGMN